jgi:hypothetical protein
VKRLLLYSPDVIGHPRVYCRAIADALADERCELFLAMGFTDGAGLSESADLHPLATRERVTILDNRTISSQGNPHLTAEELVDLQSHLGITTTLFIEADKSNDEFVRIASNRAPRLIGRNLGIFANTAEWFPGEDSFTGAPKRLVAPTLRTTLGNVKRAIFERRKSVRHFYEKTILANGVLDEILVKDERLADWFGPPVYWMPEISRPLEREPAGDDAEFLRWRHELTTFVTSNPGREPVLYFGDAAFYKGYDLFLEFVARTPSVCAIHPGRSYDAQQFGWFDYDVEALRETLRGEGRLYETNSYVSSGKLKDLYFGAIRLYITTHRLALSSATVIQATELGKPVLVPDRGLLGYRARNYNLGGVYEYGNLDDLSRKAAELWRSDLTRFAAPARAFWGRFSDAAIREFFGQRLLD